MGAPSAWMRGATLVAVAGCVLAFACTNPSGATVAPGCDASTTPCSTGCGAATAVCSAHGSCKVNPYGDALCKCDAGYRRQGHECLYASDPKSCETIGCSGHGQCRFNQTGLPRCACDAGYVQSPDRLDCVADPANMLTCPADTIDVTVPLADEDYPDYFGLTADVAAGETKRFCLRIGVPRDVLLAPIEYQDGVGVTGLLTAAFDSGGKYQLDGFIVDPGSAPPVSGSLRTRTKAKIPAGVLLLTVSKPQPAPTRDVCVATPARCTGPSKVTVRWSTMDLPAGLDLTCPLDALEPKVVKYGLYYGQTGLSGPNDHRRLCFPVDRPLSTMNVDVGSRNNCPCGWATLALTPPANADTSSFTPPPSNLRQKSCNLGFALRSMGDPFGIPPGLWMADLTAPPDAQVGCAASYNVAYSE